MCTKLLILCVLIQNSWSFEDFLINNNFTSALELLIPTVSAPSEKCRRDSLLYVEELKNLKLWASEMFDATSKFPSGLLFGSTHDFGNFDECTEVVIPLQKEKLKGKYCMAKFHLKPPKSVKSNSDFHYQFYRNGNFINVSTWEKIVAFSKDRSRRSRSDFFFSYCIPSSCSHQDLQASLKLITQKINYITNFQISVTIDENNCFVDDNHRFSIGDISFITLVSFVILIIIIATLYDLITKLEDFQQYRTTGNKHKILCAFSLSTNLKKIARKQKHEDGLECIHGLRVISMFFVILGHRLMFALGSPIVNPNFIESMYGRIEATCLLNGPIIVDTFFNISGFLASYLLLLEYEKRKSINFLMLYLHRLIRLTPTYAIVLAFYCTIFIKLGSGPFWLERIQVEQERCIGSWWANLLYLNNYINTDKICMFQSWYVTCDMHFFLIMPLFVWLLWRKPILGLSSLISVIFLSIAVVFSIVYISNEDGILLLYMNFLRDPVVNNTFKNVYIPTHMRASPYFVGILTGFIKYKMRNNPFKIPKRFVYTGWIISAIIYVATLYVAFIFYIPGKPHDSLLHAIYASMHHFMWSLCISWLILATSEGFGGWLEPIFSWNPLVLLSRITYSTFLCHGAIQLYTVAIMRQATYMSVFNLIFNTAADITLSYIAGLVLCMCFEAPTIALEKIIRGEKTERKKEEPPPIIIPKISLYKDNY